jgi:hypothetical protein
VAKSLVSEDVEKRKWEGEIGKGTVVHAYIPEKNKERNINYIPDGSRTLYPDLFPKNSV